MIGLPRSVKILVFTEPTDMRKGFDGLGALVLAAGEDLYSGHLYAYPVSPQIRVIPQDLRNRKKSTLSG